MASIWPGSRTTGGTISRVLTDVCRRNRPTRTGRPMPFIEVPGPILRFRWHTAVALFLAVALALSLRAVAAQVTIMRYAQQRNTPVNYGLPDIRRGFTLCRLRYERTRRQRKSGWWDDYPASDFNFLSRFEELSKVS